ncbi:dolichyl-phosphate beta-D-mannosyltransferase [Candidatus Kuenenbacteria bacterium HGW-Kuenenbacteria-1]|uniref:Dolichyl-phosphate beta-D-mannosyltransferase n=1 Tax=Candidatus Kuenenbacteria bacterium HGW-Kuenenbacteria-1 TaxID=2013812 RepID=A0A2N1UN30_9BACT|nr:MAG: dolichyl-phosphate beta-D-mannosyltransferase [Candidatus Kuenenbacteria bacterium HGW-Kuenenbacteria-1]
MEKNIFIIIPTYNEKENVQELIEKIFSLKIEKLQVLIVDDNSPDKTGNEVEKLKLKYPSLYLIRREKKLGLGSAYIAGFKFALDKKADLIFQMDADLSHNPKEIPNFLDQINKGFDVIVGSRKIAGGKIIGWGISRHLMSFGANWCSQWILKLKTHDLTSGFRCYRREVLETINLEKIKSNGYSFLEETIYFCERKNFKIKEIPIIFLDRQKGKSKLSHKEIINFFLTIFRLKIKELFLN